MGKNLNEMAIYVLFFFVLFFYPGTLYAHCPTPKEFISITVNCNVDFFAILEKRGLYNVMSFCYYNVKCCIGKVQYTISVMLSGLISKLHFFL